MLVDAALGLEGSPNLVSRMLEACPEARVTVIVLGDDHDADLLLAAIRAGAAGVVGELLRRQHRAQVAGAVLAGEGRSPGMLLELARRMVSRDRAPDSPLSRLSPLTPGARPAQRGWDRARIGRDLFISQHTVRTHIRTSSRSSACTQARGGHLRHAALHGARADHRRRRDGPLIPRTTTDHKEHAL